MKQIKNLSMYMLASLLLAGCSSEENPVDPVDNSEPVELGITAGVSLTKSAIDGGEQSGSEGSLMGAMAVYAVDKESTNSYKDGNNYALYTRSGSNWSAGTSHIYLTSDVATIYAYHPAYKPDATNHNMGTTEALKLTGDPTATSTIPVSVFAGKDTPEALKTNSTITVPSGYSATANKILSAPGEVDYMWGVDGSDSNLSADNKQPTASNGKTTGTPTLDAHKVKLTMKHALSMVSFRVYNTGTYSNTGKLSKIELKNNDGGKALNDGGLANASDKPTMKIADGTIATAADEGNKAAVTYTRIIANHDAADGYTLPRVTDSQNETATKTAAAVFSILVLPDASKAAKNTIEAVFTIDGATYSVDLAANATQDQWEQGKNYIYNIKLSGKELTLESVTVQAWGDGFQGDKQPNLDVN